jgi:hypothetical protein
MERPEGLAKTIQSWESGNSTKPSHGEHREVRSKVDRTIHGIRENEVGRLQVIRHSRKSPGTFLEHGKPSSFLHLSEKCKQRSREL